MGWAWISQSGGNMGYVERVSIDRLAAAGAPSAGRTNGSPAAGLFGTNAIRAQLVDEGCGSASSPGPQAGLPKLVAYFGHSKCVGYQRRGRRLSGAVSVRPRIDDRGSATERGSPD